MKTPNNDGNSSKRDRFMTETSTMFSSNETDNDGVMLRQNRYDGAGDSYCDNSNINCREHPPTPPTTISKEAEKRKANIKTFI
mmetsp:Transcript_51465/g.52444  ORF Transcript_51465/g.52444 Transcript_51465/m.52444 type:complete len:83 (-) Transcript_51465:1341-1589(-)